MHGPGLRCSLWTANVRSQIISVQFNNAAWGLGHLSLQHNHSHCSQPCQAALKQAPAQSLVLLFNRGFSRSSRLVFLFRDMPFSGTNSTRPRYVSLPVELNPPCRLRYLPESNATMNCKKKKKKRKKGKKKKVKIGSVTCTTATGRGDAQRRVHSTEKYVYIQVAVSTPFKTPRAGVASRDTFTIANARCHPRICV